MAYSNIIYNFRIGYIWTDIGKIFFSPLSDSTATPQKFLQKSNFSL